MSEFSQRLYPTSAPYKLITVLKKAGDRLRNLADIHLSDWKADIKDRTAIEDAMAFLNVGVTQLMTYVAVLDSAGYERGRPEIVLPLELVLQEYFAVSKKDEILFYSMYEFNFYYRDLYEDLNRVLNFLEESEKLEFYEGLPEHFSLISFPIIERENILTLVILLHELAHYYDQRHTPPLSAKPIDVPTEELEQWLEEAKSIRFLPEPIRQMGANDNGVPEEVLTLFLQLTILQRIQAAEIWLRELTADLAATKMLGVSFYLTAKKFLPFFRFTEEGSYPPRWKRYKEIAVELRDKHRGIELNADPPAVCTEHAEFAPVLESILAEVDKDLSISVEIPPRPGLTDSQESKRSYLWALATKIIEQCIEEQLLEIRNTLDKELSPKRIPVVSQRIVKAASLLSERIPPCEIRCEDGESGRYLDVEEIFNAAWLCWLEECQQYEDPMDFARARSELSRLALRGIELSHYGRTLSGQVTAEEAEDVQEEEGADLESPGVVSKTDLVRYLKAAKVDEAIFVTPLIKDSQISEASIDVRLGNSFIVVRRTGTEKISLTESGIIGHQDFQERISLPPDKSIILHPREFILGSTLEYIVLPNNLMAYIIGKSSLGRAGLVIATATHIAPGYRGTPTLELSNVGTVPIELKPGVPIAQLVFHGLSSPVKSPYRERGKYRYSVGPELLILTPPKS